MYPKSTFRVPSRLLKYHLTPIRLISEVLPKNLQSVQSTPQNSPTVPSNWFQSTLKVTPRVSFTFPSGKLPRVLLKERSGHPPSAYRLPPSSPNQTFKVIPKYFERYPNVLRHNPDVPQSDIHIAPNETH